ncbi:MAG: hypothetical protein ABI905_01285, partial [Betaproteobacteria bacterium]
VLNRVTGISYPAYGGEPAETVIYSYDSCANGKGRLCSLIDKTGTLSYGYDSHGRVLTKSQATQGLTQSIAYGYNAFGQQSRMTLPSGKVVSYGYANNRPASLSYDSQLIAHNADYEPFGGIGEWGWGNDTPASPNKYLRLVDLDGRVGRIDAGIGQDPVVIGYDAASRITALQRLTGNQIDPARSMSYGYDQLDRLTAGTPGAGNPAAAVSYAYDGVGNRLTSTIAGSVTQYGYGATSHRLNTLTGAASLSYTYDATGNRTADGNQAWAYAGNNRPAHITIAAPAATVQTGINALGQRVSKTVNGVTTRFVYDEAGRLIGEYENSGEPLQETLWLNDVPVAVIQ